MQVEKCSLFSFDFLFIVGINQESQDRAIDASRRLDNMGNIPFVSLSIVVTEFFAAALSMLREVKITPVSDTF